MKPIVKSSIFALLVGTALASEANLMQYFVQAKYLKQVPVPEQMEAKAWGVSTSANAGVILTFPVLNHAEAPAVEVKPRPAFIKKA